MFVTLSELQSRIETVRRHIGDAKQTKIVELSINGQMFLATRETFSVDDAGVINIEAQINERVVDCTVENNAATDDPPVKPSSPMSWRDAFERFRKNQYPDYESVTMFNFSRQRMQDAVEVAAAADEAIEWGCRWESLCSAQSELIKTLQEQIKTLSKPAIGGLI